MQNLYSTTAVKEQGLSLGIALTKQFLKGEGACRVHGGGFAGSILGFVENSEVNGYVENMKKVFGENNVFVAKIRATGTCGFKL